MVSAYLDFFSFLIFPILNTLHVFLWAFISTVVNVFLSVYIIFRTSPPYKNMFFTAALHIFFFIFLGISLRHQIEFNSFAVFLPR